MYLRLASGDYQIYDYASALTTTDNFGSSNDLSYTIDDYLTICPIHTYYAGGSCYVNPFYSSAITVMPYVSPGDGLLYWNISSSYSSVVDNAILEKVNTQWSFDDPVIQSFAEDNKATLSIPSKAFRDENNYGIKFLVTNEKNTFYQTSTIKFVPISCRYYVDQATGETVGSKTIDTAKGVDDIIIPLSPVQLKAYCSEVSFFNELSEVTFTTVPYIGADLEFNYYENGNVDLVISAGQQSRFPSNT